MRLIISLLVCFLNVGCASMKEKEWVFQDTKGRAREAQVKDFEYCTLYSRSVRPALQWPEKVGCMERRGYLTVEATQ